VSRAMVGTSWGPTEGFPDWTGRSMIGAQPITTMRRASLALLLLAAALAAGPAMAKVLAEGKPSPGGFYWQKVEKSNGSVQYLCRKTSDSKIQKAAACNGAKAVKP
jgi:hypothetical protein